jgi:alcohol dehydrogenase (NADP+)
MVTTHTLNTGAKIPAIGFGTWQDADAQEPAVTIALKAGYKHIDTARIYGTEKAVGNAIKKSGVPREELFITTKLWNNSHHPDDVESALEASLKDLGTDYVDLYLMHWPSPFARSEEMIPKDESGKIKKGDTDYVETYKAMEKTLKSGKTKAIGISNFSKAEVERLLKETNVVRITYPNHLRLLTHSRFRQPTRSSAIRTCNSVPSPTSTKRRAYMSPTTHLSATRTRSTIPERVWAS